MPSQNPDDYSASLWITGIPEAAAIALRLEAKFVALDFPNSAAIVRQAWIRYRDALDAIAARIAVVAQSIIKDEEVSSRVRPDTQGGGGPRLQDYLGISTPLTALPGAVLLNFEPELYDNVPWWWTNEEGYAGHVGREVKGFFFDAGFTSPSRPNPAEFRTHPLFATASQQRAFTPDGVGMGKRGGTGGRMTIRRPIPARRFVQRGVQKAETEWHREVGKARGAFLTSLQEAETVARAATQRRLAALRGRGRKP